MCEHLRDRVPGVFMAALALLGCACCGGCGDHRAFTAADAWFAPPPVEAYEALHAGRAISPERVHRVAPALTADADARLAGASWARLGEADARALAGRPLVGRPGTRPYLVRGVVLGAGEGHFSVAQTPGGDMAVVYGCLSRRALPMGRQPLVVELEREPRSVWTSVDVAE